jgi:hypothetical protein
MNITDAVNADLRLLMVIADTQASREALNNTHVFVDTFVTANVLMRKEPSKTSIVTLLTNVCRELEQIKTETAQAELIAQISNAQRGVHEYIKAINQPRPVPRNVVRMH